MARFHAVKIPALIIAAVVTGASLAGCSSSVDASTCTEMLRAIDQANTTLNAGNLQQLANFDAPVIRTLSGKIQEQIGDEMLADRALIAADDLVGIATGVQNAETNWLGDSQQVAQWCKTWISQQ